MEAMGAGGGREKEILRRGERDGGGGEDVGSGEEKGRGWSERNGRGRQEKGLKEIAL